MGECCWYSELMGRAYNESFNLFCFFLDKVSFFLLSDTLRDKQQRARKKKGEEVRKARSGGCSFDILCRVTIVTTMYFRAQSPSLKMHLSTMMS